MNLKSVNHDQQHVDLILQYALQTLPSIEISIAEANMAACADCRQEMDTLRPVIAAFVSWPTDVLRPPASLWNRLAQRIAGETGTAPLLSAPREAETEWEEAAPGILYKLLAADNDRNRVSMLVRLTAGTDYPSHRHAGIEELHLLHGELVIDDKRYNPGDYIRAVADSVDHRVWSETGCTCVLITSTEDVLL